MSQGQDPTWQTANRKWAWHGTKFSHEPNKSIQTKNMNSDILIVCF